jgi:glycosyltransferase involved in cell wall biosynthesis
MIRFSIIIPTYNYAEYLPRALESVIAQAGDEDELIVVDDGSTDETARLIESYNGRCTRSLRYCFQPHRGLAAARNHGIALSTHDYLLFLDADDELMPGALERLRTPFMNTGADFVVAGRVIVDSRGRRSTYYAKPLFSENGRNVYSYLLDRVIPVVPGSVTIHRRVFSRLQFPESIRLWEDRVFYARMLALFHGVSIADPIVTVYRHGDSLSHKLDWMLEDGRKTVDLIFDPDVFSPELMRMRGQYIGKIELELFQMCYGRGLYPEALKAFRNALRAAPMRVANFKILRRFLKVKFASRALPIAG